jgi:hypothetical protein
MLKAIGMFAVMCAPMEMYSKYLSLDTFSKKNTRQCDLLAPNVSASFELLEGMNAPTGKVQIDKAKYPMRAFSFGNPHPDSMRIPEIYGFKVNDNRLNMGAIELAKMPRGARLNTTPPANQKISMVGILATLLIK